MGKKISTLAVILFVLTTNLHGQYCTSDSRYSEVSFFDSTEITIAADIQYGIAPDFTGNPDTLLLDLYYPNLVADSSPQRPFIILFHGGGFSSGDKQSGDIRDLCVHLALRGFVCASANYRLGHDFSEYGQYKARYRAIQDGHAALRFVVNNSNTVRIDTNWIFVGGQSAGSLIALGIVYADQVELDSISLFYSGTSASSEMGNLLTSGNSLTNTYSVKGVFNNWGGVIASEIDPDEMIPAVAFHGELDTTVLIDSDSSFAHYILAGSRSLHNDLLTNGVCTELTVDTAGEHGIFRNESSVFRAQRASCFFKSIFCANCSSFYTTDSIAPTCSLPSGTGESHLDSEMIVYPNPFQNAFMIQGGVGMLEISIYNYHGQLVYQDQKFNREFETELMPGIYLLNIRQIESGKCFTTRLIKN